jgi:DNA-binding transcriptional LysR family regulator
MRTLVNDSVPVQNIRFGLPDDFATLFIGDILSEYRRLNPNVLLHIECDLTLNLLEKYRNNEFDLVVVKLEASDSARLGNEVINEQLVWVGQPQMDELHMPLSLVVSPQPCIYRASAIRALSVSQIPWEINFSSSSFSNVIAAVSAGVGLTVLPLGMVPEGCVVRNDHSLPKLPEIYVSILKKEATNPVLNYFEKFLLEKLKKVW